MFLAAGIYLTKELGRRGCGGGEQIRRQVGEREAELLWHVIRHVQLAGQHLHAGAVLLPTGHQLRGVVLQQGEHGGVRRNDRLPARLAARQVGASEILFTSFNFKGGNEHSTKLDITKLLGVQQHVRNS
jgi:hypothetical protein